MLPARVLRAAYSLPARSEIRGSDKGSPMRGLHATRRRVVFGMAVGLVTFAASASSEPILDQQAVREDPVTGFAVIPQQSISQTFTAGLSGLLESIEVSLYRNADAVGDVFVSLLRTPLDPTSAVFSTSIPHASIPVDRGSFVPLPVAAAGGALPARTGR